MNPRPTAEEGLVGRGFSAPNTPNARMVGAMNLRPTVDEGLVGRGFSAPSNARNRQEQIQMPVR